MLPTFLHKIKWYRCLLFLIIKHPNYPDHSESIFAGSIVLLLLFCSTPDMTHILPLANVP